MDSRGGRTGITEAQWADPSQVPSIRPNRRGQWRFRWLTDTYAPAAGDPGARDVVEIHVVAPEQATP